MEEILLLKNLRNEIEDTVQVKDQSGVMSLWILKSGGEICSLKHGSPYTTPAS